MANGTLRCTPEVPQRPGDPHLRLERQLHPGEPDRGDGRLRRRVHRILRLNPKACPVIDIIPAGKYESALAAGSDIRTDIPAYRVWVDGELADEVTDVSAVWRDDMAGVLIGCSFTFEAALAGAGVPLRHTETGRNVPMYRTNIECAPAGRIHGPMVVSMRPMPPELVETAISVTSEVPKVHGSPVHVGSPGDLGIADINRPDFGDAVEIRAGEVPVSGPAA